MSADDAQQYYSSWKNDCEPSYSDCMASPDDAQAYSNAGNTCAGDIESPLEEIQQFDVYDIRADDDSYEPGTYQTWLTSTAIKKKKIGATSDCNECGGTAIDGGDSKSQVFS